ncbi:hypothetical protein [Yersinia phage fHe-Yen9-03]|uniref:Uncharacterized protein n=1 Tax=Yersinia phage fHe-Yen9-03 TaxID=2052743 RepID=A0A2C9D0D3_9CAUD|nr:hypothetical protein [Yersinia phage fHe-Yen9-03]
MELRSSIAFIGDSEIIENIDSIINEESIIDDMVFSIDFIPELETNDTYVYRCTTDGDSWVNIYDIKTRLDDKLGQEGKYDIIYASTDGSSYIDVISHTGNFDAYLDTDFDKIQELCETYGLEFYGISDDDEDYYQDADEDDNDNYY